MTTKVQGWAFRALLVTRPASRMRWTTSGSTGAGEKWRSSRLLAAARRTSMALASLCADERREPVRAHRHQPEAAVEPLRAALGHEHLVVEPAGRVAVEDRLHQRAADPLPLALGAHEDVG